MPGAQQRASADQPQPVPGIRVGDEHPRRQPELQIQPSTPRRVGLACPDSARSPPPRRERQQQCRALGPAAPNDALQRCLRHVLAVRRELRRDAGEQRRRDEQPRSRSRLPPRVARAGRSGRERRGRCRAGQFIERGERHRRRPDSNEAASREREAGERECEREGVVMAFGRAPDRDRIQADRRGGAQARRLSPPNAAYASGTQANNATDAAARMP